MAHVGSRWPKLAPKEPQVGFMLASCCPMLGQVEPKLGPSWPQVDSRLPKLVQVGPNWLQVGPKIAKFAHVGSCWPQVGPMLAHLPGVAKACQSVHEGSASKALVFQDVHEGSASRVPTFACSLRLFHPLALHLKGCFFLVLLSTCLVMAALSKRCVPEFLSSSSWRRLFVEVSSFFVHCTKAL